ncbi:MAG: D-2-hydroxyacid dehydrogenase [Pseudomonadota bacterium]
MKHLSVLGLVLLLSTAQAQTPTGLTFDELVEETGVELGPTAMRERSGWRTPKKVVLRNLGLPMDAIRAAVPELEIVEVSSAAEAAQYALTADAIIGTCAPEAIELAPNLQWVQIYWAGVEGCVKTPKISNGSVVLTNMQKMSSPVLAEHMIAMTLSLGRALPQYTRRMADGVWQRDLTPRMQSVAGKTMLVVGLGGIGTEVARRAEALGMRVIGTRRSRRDAPNFVDYVGLSDELPTLIAEADYVLNALPLTDETADLFDADMFARMQPGAYYLNVGRGGTVVTSDLMAALESGHLAGAGLDVTDPEPLPADHPLWQFDNVIITPHVAGSGSNRERHLVLLIENLRRFAAGEALYNVVDPDDGY